MAKVIWKYEVKLGEFTNLEMPSGARVVNVERQDDSICLWALVDSDRIPRTRTFIIRGTGHEIALGHAGAIEYVGTAHFPDQGLVWHVFELL